MTRHFFSCYDIFFNTQQAFVFETVRDYCNVHDHDNIAVFFSFSSIERFRYLSRTIFCSLSLLLLYI